MDTSKSLIPVQIINRELFKDITLEYKLLPFAADPTVIKLVQSLLNQFKDNVLVYQLGNEESIQTDKDTWTLRRTIIVVFPVYIPHLPDTGKCNCIMGIKMVRIYISHCKWEDQLQDQVTDCLQKYIYIQLCRLFHNGFYETPSAQSEKIYLNKRRYIEAQVMDAYHFLEFHESGYVWLKEEYR